MQKIPVDKAAAGMVLAKPVARENGVVLMGEGTELNAAMIEKLRDLDIKRITVKGRPVDTGQEEKTLEQLLEEVENRFATVQNDKFCDQVKDLLQKEVRRRKEAEEL